MLETFKKMSETFVSNVRVKFPIKQKNQSNRKSSTRKAKWAKKTWCRVTVLNVNIVTLAVFRMTSRSTSFCPRGRIPKSASSSRMASEKKDRFRRPILPQKNRSPIPFNHFEALLFEPFSRNVKPPERRFLRCFQCRNDAMKSPLDGRKDIPDKMDLMTLSACAMTPKSHLDMMVVQSAQDILT